MNQSEIAFTIDLTFLCAEFSFNVEWFAVAVVAVVVVVAVADVADEQLLLLLLKMLLLLLMMLAGEIPGSVARAFCSSAPFVPSV